CHGIDPRLSRAPVDVAPIDEAELLSTVPWLAAAETPLTLLKSALSEPHHLVLVTDSTGHVLRSHAGAKARARAEELNVVVGANWSETKVGCTAIGLSLHDGIPVLGSRIECYSC